MIASHTRLVGAKAILVLGMHRSGTSALTRVFNLLGADISTNLMSPSKGNETGFWESTEIYEIHERLLASLGRTWFDAAPLPRGWPDSPAANLAAQELVELLKRDFSTSRMWVVKDPRICRLVPLWRRVLRTLGVSPVPVFMVRHPDEVAASLYRMVGVHHRLPEGSDYGRLLWMRHLLEAETETRDLTRSIVTYDGLLKDWRGIVSQLSRELALAWPHGIEAVGEDIEGFLTTDQRHHVVASEGEADRSAPDSGDLALRLYQVCAGDDGVKTKWQRLQKMRKSYDDGMSIVGPGFVQYFDYSAAELTKAHALTVQQANRIASLGSELYDSRHLLQQRDAELVQVRAALDEQSTLVGERSKALYETSQQLQQRDAELVQVKAALGEQSALVGERSKALYETSQQLQQRDAELVQVKAALGEQSALVGERSKALDEKSEQLQQRDAELVQVKAALDEQSALVGERSKALDEKSEQLQQRDAELQLGRQTFAAKRAEAEALQARNESLEAQLAGLREKAASRRWLLARLLLGAREGNG